MSAERTERLLNLLTLLLNTRRPLALDALRELEEFHAYGERGSKSGERAFDRDKAALLELGVPLRYVAPTDDELGGYMIDRDRYYLPPLELDQSELALMSMAGAAAAAIPGFARREALVRALAKLGFDVDEAAGPSRTLVHIPFAEGVDEALAASHLELLRDAVAARARVSIAYTDAKGAQTQRVVDPYGLYYRRGAWYLAGYCHKRRARRTFHIARLTRVEPRGEAAAFSVPADFDLAAQARLEPWEFPSHPPITVVIRVAPRLMPALGELFGGKAFVTPDGAGAIVKLEVTHREAIVSTVLPYGAAAVVLAPRDLRAELGLVYQKLAHRYAGAQAPP